MKNIEKLKDELKQFTGTEFFYKNPLFPSFVYTDGIKYLAEQAGAYWLIDYIFSNQHDSILKKESFQVWKMKVENNQAIITVDDGNLELLKKYNLEFTDFPFDEIEVWFTDRTLLLHSEY